MKARKKNTQRSKDQTKREDRKEKNKRKTADTAELHGTLAHSYRFQIPAGLKTCAWKQSRWIFSALESYIIPTVFFFICFLFPLVG